MNDPSDEQHELFAFSDQTVVCSSDRAQAGAAAPGRVPAWPQEQLLLDRLPELAGRSLLCTSPGLGQLALAAAERWPQTWVHCHFLDLYRTLQARQHAFEQPANLSIACAADFPQLAVDVVALPLSSSGEAELVREWLQQAHERLVEGGLLAVSSDNPRDTWLHQEMQKLFERVTRRPADSGVVYLARKTRPLKKLKNFACDFVFRDFERLVQVHSRPGVFAHRRVDPGARRLIDHLEVASGARVLEIGCGSGAVSLAAALRAEGVAMHAVDSNARAVACTARGAQLNGLQNLTTELTALGDVGLAAAQDLVLANPPYYANFQIARRFVLAAHAALRPGGRLLLVTKLPAWYAEHLPDWFDNVAITAAKDYHLVSGSKPA